MAFLHTSYLSPLTMAQYLLNLLADFVFEYLYCNERICQMSQVRALSPFFLLLCVWTMNQHEARWVVKWRILERSSASASTSTFFGCSSTSIVRRWYGDGTEMVWMVRMERMPHCQPQPCSPRRSSARSG